MKISRNQAKEITNLHIRLSNISKQANAAVIVEMMLDILGVSHGRYNDVEKGQYMFWRISPESVER